MMRSFFGSLLALLMGIGLLTVVVMGTRASGQLDVTPFPGHQTPGAKPYSVRSAANPSSTYAANLPFLARQVFPYEMRINAGGPTYTTAAGVVYWADQPYTPETGAGYVYAGELETWFNASVHPIGGTQDKWLYADARASFGEYRFDVPNGDYLVTLQMAALKQHAAGQSVFDVTIESSPVLTDLDIFAEANLWYAIDIPALVSVADGELNIVFSPKIGRPVLNAIALTNQHHAHATPAPPQDVQAIGCQDRNLFDWQANTEPDLLGYQVRRTSSIDGVVESVTSPLRFVPHYVDDDVEPGQTYSYQVRALNAAGQVSDASEEVSAIPLPLAATALPEYELTIAPEHLAQLNVNPWTDDYVPGIFRYDGVQYDVEVRYRGAWTNRNTPKKSWKIRFDESQLFQGHQVINLNSEFNDQHIIREKLAYDLFHAFGVDGPQAGFVHLRLNGKSWGVYTQVEHVDAYFLLRSGRPLGSNIYRVDAGGDFTLKDSLQEYETIYSKRTNEASGYDDLIALLELVNHTPDAQFPTEILKVLDVVSYLHYYATVILTGHRDVMTFYHNSFLIHDLDTGHWEVVPWDNGGALGDVYLPIDHGTPGHVLLTRLLDVPEFRLYYARHLIEALNDEFSQTRIGAMTDDYRELIGLDIYCDTWHRYWWERDFDPDLSQFVERRSIYLQSVVYSYTAGLTLPLTLQVSPDGDQLVVQNHGLLDWDLSGMTMRSEGDNRINWILPVDTLVPAGESLVLWNADGNVSGPLDLPAGTAVFSSASHIALIDKPVHNSRVVTRWTRQSVRTH